MPAAYAMRGSAGGGFHRRARGYGARHVVRLVRADDAVDGVVDGRVEDGKGARGARRRCTAHANRVETGTVPVSDDVGARGSRRGECQREDDASNEPAREQLLNVN